MPQLAKDIIVGLLTVFLVLMFVRWIVDLVLAFSRDWRPRGFMIVILEITYTVTDPPLKALRRIIPSLRMGRFSLDLSFIILIIVVRVLIGVVAGL